MKIEVRAVWKQNHPGYIFRCDEKLCLEFYLYVNDNNDPAIMDELHNSYYVSDDSHEQSSTEEVVSISKPRRIMRYLHNRRSKFLSTRQIGHSGLMLLFSRS